MTPQGWIVVARYLSTFGDWFEHDVDGVTLMATAERAGTGRYLVAEPNGRWSHTIEAMPAPDGNGAVWRVPTLDGQSAEFPRTSQEALEACARMHAPSPLAAELVDLAAQADTIAGAVRVARDGAADADRSAVYGLDEVVAWLAEAAHEMRAVAARLHRYATRPDRPCPAEWGVCPEHGATVELERSGLKWASRCRRPGCERRWDYDRAAEPCTEPAAFTAVSPSGETCDMCVGHVVALRGIENAHEWRIEPLPAVDS